MLLALFRATTSWYPEDCLLQVKQIKCLCDEPGHLVDGCLCHSNLHRGATRCRHAVPQICCIQHVRQCRGLSDCPNVREQFTHELRRVQAPCRSWIASQHACRMQHYCCFILCQSLPIIAANCQHARHIIIDVAFAQRNVQNPR